MGLRHLFRTVGRAPYCSEPVRRPCRTTQRGSRSFVCFRGARQTSFRTLARDAFFAAEPFDFLLTLPAGPRVPRRPAGPAGPAGPVAPVVPVAPVAPVSPVA